MDQETKQRIISEYVANGGSHPEVFDTVRMLDSIEQDLRDQGVDEGILATIRILTEHRMRYRQVQQDLVRNLVQVEPLPDKGLIFYSGKD